MDLMEVVTENITNDVQTAVWIAALICTYENYEVKGNQVYWLKQKDIRHIAKSICPKKIDPARTSSHCNGDNPKSTYKYFRSKDVLRRLTQQNEFQGQREFPQDLPLDKLIIKNRGIRLSDLVLWYKEIYCNLDVELSNSVSVADNVSTKKQPVTRNELNSLSVFDETGILQASLEKTSNEYHLLDPGRYLYYTVINYNGDKFSSFFIRMVYTTLKAWGMDSRAAKLCVYSDFEESVLSYADIIRQLADRCIQQILEDEEILNKLEILFFNMRFVTTGKPVLVTASKALHFFLPYLVVPIDRKYTLSFFRGTENFSNSIEKQFQLFYDIQKEFSAFSKTHKLEVYIDEEWNLSIPKIMDNMIIGRKLLSEDLLSGKDETLSLISD